MSTAGLAVDRAGAVGPDAGGETVLDDALGHRCLDVLGADRSGNPGRPVELSPGRGVAVPPAVVGVLDPPVAAVAMGTGTLLVVTNAARRLALDDGRGVRYHP